MADLGTGFDAALDVVPGGTLDGSTRYYLSGTLKDADLNPLVGRVFIFTGLYPVVEINCTYTNADGSWTMNNLQSDGPYTIIGRDTEAAFNSAIFMDVYAEVM